MIERHEEKESGRAMKFALFENFIYSSDSLKYLKLIRTTDQDPIFYVENFPLRGSRRNQLVFLYLASNNGWYCSQSKGHLDANNGCVLRNRIVQNTASALEMPPLTGWEFFNKERGWVKYNDGLCANRIETFKSLDCKQFISKPWGDLDRSKFKDEIALIASEKCIRANFCLFDLLHGLYVVDESTEHKHSCVYRQLQVDEPVIKITLSRPKKSRVNYIYKTAEGKWCIGSSVGHNFGMLYNDSCRHSEWPPVTGWKRYEKAVPIELKIIINPV